MAIRSFATEINDAAYTKVGSNVTVFSAQENYVGSIKVVVTDVGDTAPSVGESNHIPFDGLYVRNADAVDIWMISPKGETVIYGEAQ
ncbi:MAG: hypothetical protein GY820_41870 [Gammaproteobacteria bacterium]|nr:hypothetical protein [Gammaproteobacteria bacterium]